MANSGIDTAHRGKARRSLAPCAAASIVVLALACATPKPAGPLMLHPLPPTTDGYTLSQGALAFAGPDFTVTVRPWDYRLVAGELQGPGGPSPFGDTEEAVGRFLFLKVRLENRSSRALVFNPMRSALLRASDAPILPLEVADLYAFAGEAYTDVDAKARTFRRVSFNSTTTVRQGEDIERYLAFKAPKEDKQALTFSIQDLWHGGTAFDLLFPFEAYPGK